MEHDKRKLWTFMQNSLKPKKSQDSQSALLVRLGCIRSAAKVVSVPPEDPVFRGQAVLCVARALAAEQDREPLEALEECFRDILMQSAKPRPPLERFMSKKFQATWTAQALLEKMGPNFANTCHRSLLTTSRPEPMSSAALLRASWQLLRAGVRPSNSAMARSLALRAKLACTEDAIDDDAEDEVQERSAALRVLSHMLCHSSPGDMPEDLRDSILEFLNVDEVFEDPAVARSLRRINDVVLGHKAYDCCLNQLQGRFELRRLNLLTVMALKIPGLQCQHLKLLQGRLNLDPVRSLQGLLHLRRLLKIGLPKEDVWQIFRTAFQLVKSGKASPKPSRHFATALQLCADTTSSILPRKRTRDPTRPEALFPPRKRQRSEQEVIVSVEDLRQLLSTQTSEWIALTIFGLEVCRLHACQAEPAQQGLVSMQLFQEIHRWLLRCFQEMSSSGRPSRPKPDVVGLGRLSEILRQLLRDWPSDSVKVLLQEVLCEEPKGPVSAPTARGSRLELKWRHCILQAAAQEVPSILAMLRWPDIEAKTTSKVNQSSWRPYPNELSNLALSWWQELFAMVGASPQTDQVLQQWRRYVRSAHALKGGRRFLYKLASLAAANGLREDAIGILKRLMDRGGPKKRLQRCLRFASLTSAAEQVELPDSGYCSLMEVTRRALSQVQSAAKSGGSQGTDQAASAIEELDHLISNPLLSSSSIAALRSWRLLTLTPPAEQLHLACQQASPLAFARLEGKRPLEPSLVADILPLPRCLFDAWGDLEVKLTTQVVTGRSPYGTLLIEGEPLLPRAQRRHAKALHEAWSSSELVVDTKGQQESWTLPRHNFLSASRSLAFQSRYPLRAPIEVPKDGSTVAPGMIVKVTLRSLTGATLAFGQAEVFVPAASVAPSPPSPAAANPAELPASAESDKESYGESPQDSPQYDPRMSEESPAASPQYLLDEDEP